uniref:Abscisic acid receptor PYL4 n=1 Tax=Ananas comosus var. bracteatus TaxID=296719 RepID=A0A6V7QFU1_ANACO|nr:unnamed protein product [Ananas comosus var. bracteatus]
MPCIVPTKPTVQMQHQRVGSAAAAAAERCTAHEVPEEVARHHEHSAGAGQCCSAVVQAVSAPVSAVWSVVRRFDAPQSYKRFVRSCHVIGGGVHVGALREVRVVSGLPAATSRERLEILDEERHVLSFRVVGGDHRLANYRSVTTLHAAPDGEGTVVVESYVVDVPPATPATTPASSSTPSSAATSTPSPAPPRSSTSTPTPPHLQNPNFTPPPNPL